MLLLVVHSSKEQKQMFKGPKCKGRSRIETLLAWMNSVFFLSAWKFDGQCCHGRGRRWLPRICWTSYTTQPQVSSSRAHEFITSSCDVTKHVSNANFLLLIQSQHRVSPAPSSTTSRGAVETLGLRLFYHSLTVILSAGKNWCAYCTVFLFH